MICTQLEGVALGILATSRKLIILSNLALGGESIDIAVEGCAVASNWPRYPPFTVSSPWQSYKLWNWEQYGRRSRPRLLLIGNRHPCEPCWRSARPFVDHADATALPRLRPPGWERDLQLDMEKERAHPSSDRRRYVQQQHTVCSCMSRWRLERAHSMRSRSPGRLTHRRGDDRATTCSSTKDVMRGL